MTAGSGGDRDPATYLYALAPTVVVAVVGPGFALFLPDVLALGLGPVRPVGVPVVVAGLGTAVWAVHAFASAGGDPSPVGPSGRLVTVGPLSYTRNPIYLGTVAAAIGAALAFDSGMLLAYAGVLWVAYHLLVVYHEEPVLAAEHGRRYEAYREEVPRWL